MQLETLEECRYKTDKIKNVNLPKIIDKDLQEAFLHVKSKNLFKQFIEM